ncbi:hypothetical protein BASA61_005895 [Batrachochytrium salamandrivorans]|nr:hypothetical protein BASA61_005895 [Batrachochytrium salamandrivorans]
MQDGPGCYMIMYMRFLLVKSPVVVVVLANATTSKKPFEFPAIYSFPPFFTQQPTLDTWHKQRQMWCDLILSHSEHSKTFIIDLNESVGKTEPFYNPHIQRSLPRDSLVLVLDHLVTHMHMAEWVTKDRSRCLIYWRSPDEWASLVYKWVCDTGRTGTVCTTYEIFLSDETVDEPFHGIPETIITKVLDTLVKQDKSQIFNSNDGNTGVKFI